MRLRLIVVTILCMSFTLMLNVSSTTTTTASAASNSCSTSRPLNVLGMWPIQGEEPDASNNFQDGALLAIKALNKAGGVCGHPVHYQHVFMSAFDAPQAVGAYKQVQGINPDVILGLGGETEALGKLVGEGGVPVISSDLNEDAEFGGPVGSKWLWFISSDEQQEWINSTKYLVKQLGLKKVGIMGYTIPFGSVAAAASTKELQQLGLKPCANQTISAPGATDLTLQVLAMKPCDAIVNASYPDDIALELRQALQNGITVPTILQGGITVAETSKLVTGAAISNSYANADCNTLSGTPAMKAYVKAFKKAYGSQPDYLSAVTYDAVMLAGAAAEKAGKFTHAAINKAIGTVNYSGICQSYHADARQTLAHTNFILKFNSNGTWRQVASETIPSLAKLGS